MRLNLIPLYAWYVLVAAFMVLFAFPPLIAGTILLELERAFGWPFFDASRGGDAVLWQHLFWIFGHPEVYIIFLPSVALIAMIVPTAVRRPLVGYSWIVLSAIGTGFLSFGLWVHHMFTTGLPGVTLAIFSAASMAVAIPTGIQIFCFIATLLAGTVTRSVPMLYITGGLSTFVIGGLTGVMVAMAPFNFQAHDTYFVVAHLHTVLIAGAVFPVIAGLYYYFPLALDKQLSERLGRVSFWMVFVGFNATFLPMHWTGLLGLPRRVFTYPAGMGLETLNLLSTVGAFVLAAGFLVVAWDVVRPKQRQPNAPRNPWNAGSVEWLQEIPGQPWGVRTIPRVETRYPLWEQPGIMADYDAGRFLPARCRRRPPRDARHLDDRRRADPVHAHRRPHLHHADRRGLRGRHLHLPHLQVVLVDGRQRRRLDRRDLDLVMDRQRARSPRRKPRTSASAPPCRSTRRAAIRWAGGRCASRCSAIFSAFISLVFGYFFYWSLREDFAAAASARDGIAWSDRRGGGDGGLLGVDGCRPPPECAGPRARVLRYVAADRDRLRHDCRRPRTLAGPWYSELDPTAGVYPAMVWLLAIWSALHVVVGVDHASLLRARGAAAGRMTARYDMDIVNVTLYWHFAAATVAITLAIIAGFPYVA